MNQVLFGDCRDSLRKLAEQGVKAQVCVTSPPYFGLRDYGHDGQIGLEETPEQYIAAMVEVFRCVRDVLADDGTLWVNIGDSYAGGGGGNYSKGTRNTSGQNITNVRNRSDWLDSAGLKQKDLIGIPWLLAFALRADGWYLRQEIIWHKPNAMPESVTDRCTKAHESLFLLAKSPRYLFDHEAIKEAAVSTHQAGNKTHKHTDAYEAGDERLRTKAGLVAFAQRSRANSFKREESKRAQVIPGQTVGTHRADRAESEWDIEKRNRRSVWSIPTKSYSGAHFAVFPAALVEPCILAGSRAGDIVLDPFMGSGTTAAVAIEHGRQFIGCELNTDYKPLQDQRIAEALAAKHEAEEAIRIAAAQLDLFAEVP